jgi:hypothetical protein
MRTERDASLEEQALERIANAAREVYAASAALKVNFGEEGVRQPSALALVRFATAMQELQEARDAFDALVSEKWRNEGKASSAGLTSESLQR